MISLASASSSLLGAHEPMNLEPVSHDDTCGAHVVVEVMLRIAR